MHFLCRVLAAAAKRGKRKGPKVRVDGEDELGDELGGTPTPMVMPKAGTAAHAAYAAGRDKRKRKVGVVRLMILK
jgi:hypothetical protein